jgi:YVTN family beta-propeller protein
MGLGLLARPAEAAPFAYVVNFNDGTVSVIDTATNTVVATVAVGTLPIVGKCQAGHGSRRIGSVNEGIGLHRGQHYQ